MIALMYCGFLASNLRAAAIRASGMAIGGLLITAPLYLYNSYVLNIDVLFEMLEFAKTATQGEFSEGIVFPFYYLGNAEAGIALVWMLGVVIAGWQLARQSRPPEMHRAKLWFACLFILYLLMILFSTVLQQFRVFHSSCQA